MSFDQEPYWYGKQGMYGSTGWNTVQWGEWNAGQMQRRNELAAAAQRAEATAQEAESGRRMRMQANSNPLVVRPISNPLPQGLNGQAHLSIRARIPRPRPSAETERVEVFDLDGFLEAYLGKFLIGLNLFLAAFYFIDRFWP